MGCLEKFVLEWSREPEGKAPHGKSDYPARDLLWENLSRKPLGLSNVSQTAGLKKCR